MDKDGLFKLHYDFQSIEGFLVDANDRVWLGFIGGYAFEQSIEEILRDSEDAEAILALLKRNQHA